MSKNISGLYVAVDYDSWKSNPHKICQSVAPFTGKWLSNICCKWTQHTEVTVDGNHVTTDSLFLVYR